MSQQQEYWFAARTRKDQELTTRDALEKIGVEYFLPTQFVIRQLKYRRRRVEVPVIRNLIFVHATKEFACAIANEYGVRLFVLMSLSEFVAFYLPVSRFLKATFAFSHRNQ